jgi:hypothetical protein
MELDFSLFANAAEVGEDGRLSLLSGGFNALKALSFPATRSGLSLIVRLSAAPNECGVEHTFRCELRGPDGLKYDPDLESRFTIKPHPINPEKKNWTILVFSYAVISFPRPGEYTFRIIVDGEPVGEDALDVL